MCLEEDSVRMVLLYQSLEHRVYEQGVGHKPNPTKFHMKEEFRLITWRKEGEGLRPADYSLHVKRFYEQLIEDKKYYKCGFYQIRIYKYGEREQEYTRHFTKCNPNY